MAMKNVFYIGHKFACSSSMKMLEQQQKKKERVKWEFLRFFQIKIAIMEIFL